MLIERRYAGRLASGLLSLSVVLGGCASAETTPLPFPTRIVQPIQSFVPETTIAIPTEVPLTNPSPKETTIFVSTPGTLDEIHSSHDVHAQVNYDQGTVTATDDLTITNSSNSLLEDVHLSVIPHSTGEWTLEQSPSGTIWENPASLLVPVLLKPNQSESLDFAFAIKPSANLSNDIDQRLSRANDIMQLAGWLPLVSDGHDVVQVGDSQVTPVADEITVDYTLNRPMYLAAPGRLIDYSGAALCSNQTACEWSSTSQTYEINDARDLTFSISPNYTVQSETVGQTLERMFYNPKTVSSETTKNALSVGAKALKTYSQWYNEEYPWPTFTIAQAPDANTGDEWPAIVTIGKNDLSAYVIDHEIAHQWWYAMVGDDQINNPWLDEAFAEFSARTLLGMNFSYDSTLAVGLPSTYWKDFGCNQYGECYPNGYGQTVYYKGAAFLNNLRSAMGETNFWNAMRDIQQEYHFRIADQNGVLATFLMDAKNQAVVSKIIKSYGFPPVTLPKPNPSNSITSQ
jgi:hypothetical protein